MRLISTLVVVGVLSLAGCGGDDPAAEEPAEVEQSSASMTLAELCPEVEAALPRDMMVPKPQDLEQIAGDLEPLQEQADTEARNALLLLVDGVERAQAAYDDSSLVLPALDASEAFDRGVGQFADRCQAAGSTAFR